MRYFRYKCERYFREHSELWVELNQEGGNGWEVVSIIEKENYSGMGDMNYMVVFKKEVLPEEKSIYF